MYRKKRTIKGTSHKQKGRQSDSKKLGYNFSSGLITFNALFLFSE